MNLDILFENFEMLANAPNSVPKLREMILQLAVQGKLVPQDPKDEPASVLLEKIRTEKERLIKEKKIRKIKPLPPIEPREIPSELPEGWTWTRIGNVGNIFNGNSVNARLKDEKYTNINGGLPFIATKDVGYGWEELYYDNGVSIPKDEPKFKVAHKGAVLICSEGGSAGKKCGITNRDICFGNKLYAIELYVNVESSYILANYLSPMFFLQFGDNMTGIIGGISATKFRQLILPVPPLAEQHRIVTKVDQLMALCDELETRKQKRDKSRIALNDAALDRLLSARKQKDFTKHWNRIHRNFDLLYDTPETVDKLRQAILQLAVQGKLVPQDPKEPPASILIDRIAKEKARLIDEGKSKKQKPLTKINEHEMLFNLPEGWGLIRFSELSQEISTGPFGSMIHKRDYVKGGVPLINPSHMINDVIVEDQAVSVSLEMADKLSAYKLSEGDIVMARRGEMGRCALVTQREKGWLCGTGSFRLKFHDDLNRSYILFLFKTEWIRNYLGGKSVGSTMTNLNHGILKMVPVPLPPRDEQHRIVAKVGQLMALCDELEDKLSQSQTDCDELLNTIASNIENVSTSEFQITKNSETTTKKETSTSKPQRNTEKSEKRFGKPEALKAFRKAIFRQKNVDELTLLRLVGRHLGVKRVSKSIRQDLESYINTAIRRKILFRDGDGYSAGAPTIEYYEDEFLIKVLRSLIRKDWEYQREYLVDEAASYLGFDQASDAFKDRMKSVFRITLHQKALYRNGQFVGKT